MKYLQINDNIFNYITDLISNGYSLNKAIIVVNNQLTKVNSLENNYSSNSELLELINYYSISNDIINNIIAKKAKFKYFTNNDVYNFIESDSSGHRAEIFVRGEKHRTETFKEELIDLANERIEPVYDQAGKPYFNNAQATQNKTSFEIKKFLMQVTRPSKYGAKLDLDDQTTKHEVKIGFDFTGANNIAHTNEDDSKINND